MNEIRVKHPNGYSGVLYGKSSMLIFGPDGKEVLHTGFRNPDINNAKALYKQLEEMPEFIKVLFEGIERHGIDDSDEEDF